MKNKKVVGWLLSVGTIIFLTLQIPPCRDLPIPMTSSARDPHINSNSSSPRTPTLHHHRHVADGNPLLPPSFSPAPPPSSPRTPKAQQSQQERTSILEIEAGAGVSASSSSSPDASPGSSSVPSFSWKKLWKFTGPGFLMSVAFLDPGNLEGDLQSGAVAGYSLLWLLLGTTLMGLLIQLLSMRLGVATGRHLAEICRDEYPFWSRITLWLMAEIALIGADIQEVIGTAIAIKILSRGVLPLWAGIVITVCDCLIFLFLENFGIRILEASFGVLISMMAASFAWMFVDTKPDGYELMEGIFVPKLSSKTIQKAVGVVGCVITPYNVFLYSALVQSRNIDPKKRARVQEALTYFTIESWIAVSLSFIINLFVMTIFAKGFYGTPEADTIGLINAGDFLEQRYGGGMFPILYIWGVGLLAAGQSSTISGTYAGQFIMGGFLDLPIKKWLRSLITRSVAILPTIIVAVIFNRSEELLDVVNEWLNILQAMQIPFAIIPLLHLVADEHIMGVFKIGTNLERTSWGVAAVVILVNVYVLVDFFVSKVDGLLVRFFVFLTGAAYAAFIVYLILQGTNLVSWFGKTRGDGFAYIRT